MLFTSMSSLLLLVLTVWTQGVYSQCGGTPVILNANNTYQNFSTVNYPSGYTNQLNCEWRIEADNANDAIRVEIIEADIEYHAKCVNDYGEAFDGDNVNATSLGTFCGTSTPSYVSYDSNMTVVFISDYSVTRLGFIARYKSGPRSSLVDDAEEASSIMMFVIIGAAGGFVIVVVVIVIIVCKYKQSKEEQKRRRPIEVQPFAVASTWSQQKRGFRPPPAYGETISPPPRYSDVAEHPPPPGFKGQTDGITNTRFVVPDNLRSTTTQIGNSTNGAQTNGNSGVVTANIFGNTASDPLPSDNSVPADRIPNTEATRKSSTPPAVTGLSADNGTTAIVPASNSVDNTVNNPINNPVSNEGNTGISHPPRAPGNGTFPFMPQRNAPGETLTELMSESDDDSETDSDDSFDYEEA